MALQQQTQTKAEWPAFFVEIDIPQAESDTYATTFTDNHITELTMSRTDKATTS